MMPVLVAVTAVVSSVAAWRAWTGRWTSWARQALKFTWPLHMLPGVGALATVAVVGQLVGGDLPTWTAIVTLPAVISMAFGFVGFFGEPPEWTTPR